MQTTQYILLVRPSGFAFNLETASSNAFQNHVSSRNNIQLEAINEFNAMVNMLNANGISVFVFDDTLLPAKPDAVFPNNWITFHPDGTVVLYPMFAPNRRLERRLDIIDSLRKHFNINAIVDLSIYEKENRFLEGTGSIVFDHINKIAYASISCRTDKDLFIMLCKQLNYEPLAFHAYDKNGNEIYHTNVVMCVGERFAVVCLDTIPDLEERNKIINAFSATGHDLIDISFEQMNHFAGNMLQVKSDAGRDILVLSETASNSLTETQKSRLLKYVSILPCSIHTIETIGGGSARCMMAEIFLPPKPSS